MNVLKVGEKISQARKDREMTQKELADKLGITDKAVSKWERGLNYPELATLEKLADCLDMSVVELLGLESDIEKVKEDEQKMPHENVRNVFAVAIVYPIISVIIVIALVLVKNNMDFLDNIGVNMPLLMWIYDVFVALAIVAVLTALASGFLLWDAKAKSGLSLRKFRKISWSIKECNNRLLHTYFWLEVVINLLFGVLFVGSMCITFFEGEIFDGILRGIWVIFPIRWIVNLKRRFRY